MMSVTHNTALNRYEMKTDHGLAIAVYRQQGNSLVFTHTEVPAADEGKGYASKVVKEALDDTSAGGSRSCPPAASWSLTSPATRSIRTDQPNFRRTRKVTVVAIAVANVPHARSTTVTLTGQPRSVARLVKS